MTSIYLCASHYRLGSTFHHGQSWLASMLLEYDTIRSLSKTVHLRDWDSWYYCSQLDDILYMCLVCCYNLANGRDCSCVQLLYAHLPADRSCCGRIGKGSTRRW